MTYCTYSNQDQYPFELPKLPYAKDAFIPDFSSETFDYHHGKHHNAYVTNLNNMLVDNKELRDLDLEQIMARSHNTNVAIFNNAAQIWNHTFFWHSMKPSGGGKPKGDIAKHIEQDFGSYDNFATEFKQAGLSQFGSGWAWLVYCPSEHKLKIIKTSNAETPLIQGMKPLIACDVWEHAYYIDYRNKRPDYVALFIAKLLNWDFAEMNLTKCLAEK
ncbi:MAG: superoxide dismutase [Rickettsiaceae bacterium]